MANEEALPWLASSRVPALSGLLSVLALSVLLCTDSVLGGVERLVTVPSIEDFRTKVTGISFSSALLSSCLLVGERSVVFSWLLLALEAVLLPLSVD